MKKQFLLLISIFTFLLAGCSYGIKNGGVTSFIDLKEYMSNKAAWTEPENYSFTYSFDIGDSLVGAEAFVTVTQGVSKVYKNSYYDENLPVFSTVTEMLNYYNAEWDNRRKAADTNTDHYVKFSTCWATEGKYVYPYHLYESVSRPGYDGYGGISLYILNFSLENKATMAEKKAAWTDPESYSLNYIVFGDNGTGGECSSLVEVSYDKDEEEWKTGYENQTDFNTFVQKFSDSVTSHKDFAFTSISQLYDFIETEWTAAEASGSGFAVEISFEKDEKYYPAVFKLTKFSTSDSESNTYIKFYVNLY